MDVTNSSDQDSQYRVAGGEKSGMGGGQTPSPPWKPLPKKGADKPQLGPWTVEFKVGNKVVSATITDPTDHVILAKQPDGTYQAKVIKTAPKK
ncbi:MAG TPA: hypothetical protein VOA87_02745 [Thermoanaerobaculia bacterium]|nr:hypothetical protein [Thermoanaerobaculia bacterium]